MIELGSQPPSIVLEDKEGGFVADGEPWSSSMIQKKVYAVVYLDPDSRHKNRILQAKLKSAEFNLNHFGSIVVINLAATWLPNAILKPMIKKEQKDKPYAHFVFDAKKKLVQIWGLKDKDYNFLLFDSGGKCLYISYGEISLPECKKVIQLIRDNIKIPKKKIKKTSKPKKTAAIKKKKTKSTKVKKKKSG